MTILPKRVKKLETVSMSGAVIDTLDCCALAETRGAFHYKQKDGSTRYVIEKDEIAVAYRVVSGDGKRTERIDVLMKAAYVVRLYLHERKR
jgi:hypothetical protein